MQRIDTIVDFYRFSSSNDVAGLNAMLDVNQKDSGFVDTICCGDIATSFYNSEKFKWFKQDMGDALMCA